MTLLSGREVWVRFLGRSNQTQCHLRLVTAAMFLRSCVVQKLNRGDGSRHSLHASMKYRECNEGLNFRTWLNLTNELNVEDELMNMTFDQSERVADSHASHMAAYKRLCRMEKNIVVSLQPETQVRYSSIKTKSS